eukprot:Gregarina_sp_Poly_1__1367@NODE_1339_length_4349_cov_94_459131_g721_i1_p4_GENE_NODE_1339_length_4349_cov_94_459131_g721_i1NODE_1339_length_4349_cov_94_459131_g721_i1_p4_ORF_typecomplete_len135_score19_35DUF2423/PF10338_9/0_11_NODE_1339_length_4349_cov_94_459131_g721_i1408812
MRNISLLERLRSQDRIPKQLSQALEDVQSQTQETQEIAPPRNPPDECVEVDLIEPTEVARTERLHAKRKNREGWYELEFEGSQSETAEKGTTSFTRISAAPMKAQGLEGTNFLPSSTTNYKRFIKPFHQMHKSC